MKSNYDTRLGGTGEWESTVQQKIAEVKKTG
jgi:hypothetical protein